MAIWNFLMSIPAFVNNSLQLPERAQKRPKTAVLLVLFVGVIGLKTAGNSTVATGISADPGCQNKLRLHFFGGAVTGVKGTGIKANTDNVCIEAFGTRITGGTDGIDIGHGRP
jgi:hypothetical protein